VARSSSLIINKGRINLGYFHLQLMGYMDSDRVNPPENAAASFKSHNNRCDLNEAAVASE